MATSPIPETQPATSWLTGKQEVGPALEPGGRCPTARRLAANTRDQLTQPKNLSSPTPAPIVLG